MLHLNMKHRLSQDMADERQAQARQLAVAALRRPRLPARRNRLLATLNTLVQALEPGLLVTARTW